MQIFAKIVLPKSNAGQRRVVNGSWNQGPYGFLTGIVMGQERFFYHYETEDYAHLSSDYSEGNHEDKAKVDLLRVK